MQGRSSLAPEVGGLKGLKEVTFNRDPWGYIGFRVYGSRGLYETVYKEYTLRPLYRVMGQRFFFVGVLCIVP